MKVIVDKNKRSILYSHFWLVSFAYFRLTKVEDKATFDWLESNIFQMAAPTSKWRGRQGRNWEEKLWFRKFFSWGKVVITSFCSVVLMNIEYHRNRISGLHLLKIVWRDSVFVLFCKDLAFQLSFSSTSGGSRIGSRPSNLWGNVGFPSCDLCHCFLITAQ